LKLRDKFETKLAYQDATVYRLARRFKKTENAEAMIWKLMRVAEQSWRKLNAPKLLQKVYEGKPFRDGIAVKTKIEPRRKAA